MYETIKVHAVGIAPLMVHNGQTSDPLSLGAQQLSSLNSKRKKTPEDHLAIGRAEWMHSFYVDENDRPVLPSDGMESALTTAAKKFKLGGDAKMGLLVECAGKRLVPILYDGPKTRAEMWEVGGLKLLKTEDGPVMHVGKFSDRRPVRVTTSKVLRTRPVWPSWELRFDVKFLSEVFKRREVEDIINKLGMLGIFEWRPKCGRFMAEFE